MRNSRIPCRLGMWPQKNPSWPSFSPSLDSVTALGCSAQFDRMISVESETVRTSTNTTPTEVDTFDTATQTRVETSTPLSTQRDELPFIAFVVVSLKRLIQLAKDPCGHSWNYTPRRKNCILMRHTLRLRRRETPRCAILHSTYRCFC